jgi:type VI secretion system IcmF/VasK family protein
MKRFMGAVNQIGGVVILILVVLLMLTWFGGEGLGWSRNLRAILTVAVLVVFVIVILVQKLMAVRGALLIEDRLKAQGQEQIQGARPDQRSEIQAVNQQLEEAIATLKNSRLGRGALYAMPWYMIIGPPGSGKSTALSESGLNFPYVSQGRRGVRGVGGTRNCDWWFTDEGILLDTAGRYTTELDDRDEWMSFLGMLKKARKGKPINGAIVAVSVADLLSGSEESVQAHAKNIRDRLDELVKQLELVFPVYLMFTKCDLMQGFVEFFEDYTRQDRAQVWGCTFPYAAALEKPYRELFDEECRKLFQGLASQRLASLAAERPAAKKQNIFLFPVQFSMGLKRFGDFVEALFRPNPFQEAAVFRGFYFSSGTQEGAPIDQVIRSLSSAFGLKETSSAAAPVTEKKSYFINHLFTKIIFPDQNLARTSARLQKRHKLLYFATLAGSVAATVVLTAAFAVSFFANRGLLGAAETAAVKAREAVAGPPAAAVEALDGLRREVEGLDRDDRKSPPLSRRWGLYRGGAVNAPVRKAYFDALRRLLLAPAGKRILEEMTQLFRKEGKSAEDYERLNDLHRTYQMLGGELDPDRNRDLIERVLRTDDRWTAGVGGGPPSPAADRHLQFLLSQLDRPADWKTPIDTVVVNRIKEDLSQGLWPLQSYRDIIESGRGSFGKLTGDSLVKSRGKDLFKFTYEFPRLFTQEGWNDYVRTALRAKSEALARRYAELKVEKTAAQVEEDLRRRHVENNAREWEKFLEGVQLLPFGSLEDAASKVKVLTGDTSPYLDLFRGVWEGQSLKTLDTEVKAPVDLKPVKEGLAALYEFLQAMEDFAGSAAAGSRVLAGLKEKKLEALQEAFKKAGRALDGAARQAPPQNQERFRQALQQVIENVRQALAAEAQAEADALWDRSVARVHRDSFKGRYPFVETGEKAVMLQTFSKVFSPQGGTFWSAHADLKALNALNVEGKPLVQFSREFTAAVKKAESFRQALYKGGGEKVQVTFAVTLKQREGVTHVRFGVGKQEFNHNDRPDGRGELTWKEAEAPGAKISIRVGGVESWVDKEFKDDWAIVRLVGSGKPQPQGEQAYACSWEYKVDRLGTSQIFYADAIVEAQDRVNPFQKDFFTKFEVPDKVGP